MNALTNKINQSQHVCGGRAGLGDDEVRVLVGYDSLTATCAFKPGAIDEGPG